MSLIRFLLRESRRTLLLSILTGVISGASSVGLIALVQAELARNQRSSWSIAIAFLGLCVLAQLTRIVAQTSMVRLAQDSVARLATHLCRKILSIPLARFEERDPATLVAILTEDIAILANALVGIPVIAITVPIVLVCLAYVGWLSPVVLACGLGVAIPTLVVYQITASRAVQKLRAARAGQDVMVDHFRSLIEGFRELKLHQPRRAAFLAEIETTAQAVRTQTSEGFILFAWAGSGSQVAYFGVIGFLLFVLPSFYPVSRDVLSGTILAILYIMAPLEVIMNWIPILSRAHVSLQKIEALDPSLLERENLEGPHEVPLLCSEIQLVQVTDTYRHAQDREDFVLGPIDLTIRPGEVLFLVGGNGSGKTTLVKLISGLHLPQVGEIHLDGRPITEDSRESYRQLFSVIFADGHLFKSLRGLEGPDLDARAKVQLVRLGLDHLVRVEQGTFSTTDLSQGQRRRLALLIALLEDRPVYIFDEWASNQDPYFKKFFYHEILAELRARGKAVLVISHDEEFFATADRLVWLDSGRLSDNPQERISEYKPTWKQTSHDWTSAGSLSS